MAGLLDRIGLGGLDERFQRFSTNPIGMASLGLLLQPRMRPAGSSGFDYALQGMQTAAQNRQTQAYAQRLEEETKARQQEQERQTRVMQMLSAGATPEERALMASMSPEEWTNYQKYRMDIANDQQKRIEAARIEEERKRQTGALSQFRIGLSGPERLAFDALPLEEQVKIVSAQNFPPPQQLTNTEKVLIAAGLKPGTKEYQDAAMEALMRPRVQVNTGEGGGIPLGKVPSGYMINPEDPSRIVPIPGAPAVAPVMTNEEKLAFEAEKASSQLSSKQAFAQQQAATAVQRLGSALSRFSGMSALTPTDRAEYSSILDAAANAIAKARGTPGAEPPAPAIDRARASLPSIEELLTAPVLGNTAEAKMRALLEEFGGGAKMTTPGGAQVTTDMTNGGWTTLPNGVRVRRKQ